MNYSLPITYKTISFSLFLSLLSVYSINACQSKINRYQPLISAIELLLIDKNTCKISSGEHNNAVSVSNKNHNSEIQISYVKKQIDECTNSYYLTKLGGYINGSYSCTVEKQENGQSQIVLFDPAATMNTQRVRLVVNVFDTITIEEKKRTRHGSLASRITVSNSTFKQEPRKIGKFNYKENL